MDTWKLTPEEIMAAVNEALKDPSKGIENTVADKAGQKALKAVAEWMTGSCPHLQTMLDGHAARETCARCRGDLLYALRSGTLPGEKP